MKEFTTFNIIGTGTPVTVSLAEKSICISDMHREEPEYKLEVNNDFLFPDYLSSVKFTVEWTSRSRMVCDLQLQIYCFDERVSLEII